MKKLLIIISVFMVFSACSKLEDLNKNTKDFTTVSGQSLYNGATRVLINQLFSINVNNNNTLLFVQHWTETTYPDESQYDMVTRSQPATHQNLLYRNVLANYKQAAQLMKDEPIGVAGITQKQRDNQLAIIEIMSVYAWSNIIETFGDMPYKDALDFTKPQPTYDDGLTVYKDLIARLNTALGKMDPASAGMPTGFDNIFGGTAAGTVKWIHFANTLKLRMGLMLADVDAATAKAAVESAAPNVFIKDEKATMNYLSAAPNQNPFYTDLVVSGRSDFTVASIIINAMQITATPDPLTNVLTLTVNDPRLPFYATKTDLGVYLGGKQGAANSYNSFSHVNYPSTSAGATVPLVIMDYAEAEFLLAEAVERGFSVGGTAESHYNAAVTASIVSWGGTAAQATAYLAQPTVAYATAFTNWKQKVGTQAWIAYWMRGFAAWNSFRRLDYPKLLAPAKYYEDINAVPTRYTYAVSEQTLNLDSYTAAAAKIGGDKALTKIFWDKN